MKKIRACLISLVFLMSLTLHSSGMVVPQSKSPKMTSDDLGIQTNNDKDKQSFSSDALKIGDKRVLFRENKKQILMASYLQDYKSLIKALKAGDDYGIVELARDEGLFLVPNHVQVIVLETATIQVEGDEYPAVKVRVIKGKAEGKAGWVPEKWLLEISG